MIDAVHRWQVAAAIGATQANEAGDANDAGEKPSVYEGRTVENVLSVVFVDGKGDEY